MNSLQFDRVGALEQRLQLVPQPGGKERVFEAPAERILLLFPQNFLRLQHHEIFRSHFPNGCERYPGIECHKPTVVPDGEPEKV
ncbi:MAG: hypothetical protein ACREUL_07570 [Steroidobacteraceae bacterium]